MFQLRITSNGQPDITTDLTLVPGYSHWRGDAIDFTPKTYAGETIDQIADIVARVAPESRTRRVSKGQTLRVRYPSAMVSARDTIESDWNRWASEGMSRDEMRSRAINHPAFAAYL